MKIYSPAFITTKGRLSVGHGANLVWCDVLGRRERQKGGYVEYFFPSWNHQGKRLDTFGKQDLENKLKNMEEDFNRQLNLFGIEKYTEYRDTDSKSRENAKRYFIVLKEKKFIKYNECQYFLDIKEIVNRTNLLKILEEMRFAQGDQIRKRLVDLAYTLNGMYPISKKREFATEMPGESESSQKINPIFDLAVSPLLFSEESMDYSIDGSRTLLHGTFIPLLVWAGLFNKPFSKNISVHGYSLGDTEMAVDKFYEKINADILNSDIMRYCAIRCTESFEDMEVNLDSISGGKKLLYRTLNLSKHILKHYGTQERETNEDEGIKEFIETMYPSKAISYFESEIFAISRNTHHKGRIDKEDVTRFLRNVNVIKSIFPITVKRIEEIVYDGKL